MPSLPAGDRRPRAISRVAPAGSVANILDAALRRFEERGLAATTMDAIAGEAGVALKTRLRGL